MPPINGTIASWDGTKGSIKSESESSKDQEFSFEKADIQPMKYSAPYEPKVGDYVTSLTKKEGDDAVVGVMESLR